MVLGADHFYSFGVLLAYSFAFGIRDLHNQNLVVTESHIQAIDAEVVLADLILPNESVLLPYKDIEFESCGARTLRATMGGLSNDDRRNIFSGYVDTFAAIFKSHAQLCATFDAIDLTAPIRVIVRNTKNYKSHLNRTVPIQDLLSEEVVQLERGDIPYFFKKLGDERLFYLNDKNFGVGTVQDLGRFKTDIDRHAQSPKKLIGNTDLIERKMVQGIFLFQKQFGDFGRYEFRWNGRNLSFDAELAQNDLTGHTFRKKASSQIKS